MASLEDYDEFGNYIGADLDSDDEDVMHQDEYAPQQRATSAQPLEGFDEDSAMPGAEEGALMQIDGVSASVLSFFQSLIRIPRTDSQCRRVA